MNSVPSTKVEKVSLQLTSLSSVLPYLPLPFFPFFPPVCFLLSQLKLGNQGRGYVALVQRPRLPEMTVW
jgi:hypothetical protein